MSAQMRWRRMACHDLAKIAAKIPLNFKLQIQRRGAHFSSSSSSNSLDLLLSASCRLFSFLSIACRFVSLHVIASAWNGWREVR